MLGRVGGSVSWLQTFKQLKLELNDIASAINGDAQVAHACDEVEIDSVQNSPSQLVDSGPVKREIAAIAVPVLTPTPHTPIQSEPPSQPPREPYTIIQLSIVNRATLNKTDSYEISDLNRTVGQQKKVLASLYRWVANYVILFQEKHRLEDNDQKLAELADHRGQLSLEMSLRPIIIDDQSTPTKQFCQHVYDDKPPGLRFGEVRIDGSKTVGQLKELISVTISIPKEYIVLKAFNGIPLEDGLVLVSDQLDAREMSGFRIKICRPPES